MKKVLLVFMMAFGFAACNEGGREVEVKTDSLSKELDTLGKKIGDRAEKVWDSTRVKAGELKDDIESRFEKNDKKQDSIR
jgi:RNase adaptor protein for sRNA GlmZ degradation